MTQASPKRLNRLEAEQQARRSGLPQVPQRRGSYVSLSTLIVEQGLSEALRGYSLYSGFKRWPGFLETAAAAVALLCAASGRSAEILPDTLNDSPPLEQAFHRLLGDLVAAPAPHAADRTLLDVLRVALRHQYARKADPASMDRPVPLEDVRIVLTAIATAAAALMLHADLTPEEQDLRNACADAVSDPAETYREARDLSLPPMGTP